MSHSQEPWSIPIDEEGWLCINCAGGTVLGLPHWVQQEMSATMLSAEDAHRIVACVNACRGIPNELLEANVIFQFIEQAKNYKRYLDTDGMTLCRLNEVALAAANALEKSP